MSPEEIKELRRRLGCTARELADTLGLDPKTLAAWESADAFPTKRWVSALQELDARGPGAVKRKSRGKARASAMQRLADPQLWELVRKLAGHPALLEEVSKLAAEYPDPATEGALAGEGVPAKEIPGGEGDA